MKDPSHSKPRNDSFLSEESDDQTSRTLSFLNTPQHEYQYLQLQQQQLYQPNREGLLFDDGDDHALQNERPSKKAQYATNVDISSFQKAHQPESADASDYGLGPKMSRYQSQGTPPPPPPSNRSKPGAMHIPGFEQTGASSVSLPSESTLRSLEPTKSSAPILHASVVHDEREQSSSPIAPLPVLAEPMKEGEGESKRSCCAMLKDRRLLTILVILIVTILSFAIGISVVLSKNKETISTTTVEYISATPAPTAATTAPTAAPTEALEFLPPSPAQCQQIEAGNEVANQYQMVLKTYQIELDVAIVEFASLTTLENRMQAILAPRMAQCDDMFNLRRLRGNSNRIQSPRRKLASDYLVANAKFSSATLQNNRSCKVGAPQPCYKVIETIDLYLQQEESDVSLISLIMDAFDGEPLVQLLHLEYPFESVDLIGVSSSSTDTTNNNTIQDSHDDED
ncbi:MAG: hypothetical protein SGBAC_007620 [Bacillariaceae sp.]